MAGGLYHWRMLHAVRGSCYWWRCAVATGGAAKHLYVRVVQLECDLVGVAVPAVSYREGVAQPALVAHCPKRSTSGQRFASVSPACDTTPNSSTCTRGDAHQRVGASFFVSPCAAHAWRHAGLRQWLQCNAMHRGQRGTTYRGPVARKGRAAEYWRGRCHSTSKLPCICTERFRRGETRRLLKCQGMGYGCSSLVVILIMSPGLKVG